jgi:hypothetical protein
MELAGLLDRILLAVENIDWGRRGLSTNGGEHKGRLHYSLKAALQSFDDAFLVLEVVEGSGYKDADKTWPHTSKYRVQNYPKDAYHLACIAHRTRLHNSLRTPGINMIEKAVFGQRIANMKAAQNAYIEKQKKVFVNKV